MIIRKENIYNWYYIGILLVLAVASYLAMPDLDNTAEAGTGKSFLAVVGLAVIQIPLLIYIVSQRIKSGMQQPKFIIYYNIYFCWMLAITLFNDNVHNIFGMTTLAMTILVVPFILSTSYYRARYSDLDKWFYMAVIIIMLLIAIQYKNLYSIVNMIGDENTHIGVSYFPLFILPILLLPSSRIIRYISIIITAIIIISSIKRGGLIALGSSLLIYVFIKQSIGNKNKIRQWIILGSVILLMTGVLYYLDQSEDNDVVERISNIQDDGGSGRDVIWEDTFQNIITQDWGSRMLGNGYRSAQTVSKYHLPAHNDILEIWYDFGGIGLILYGLAFFSLCAYTIRLIKRKSQYAPHMAMTIIFYIIFSMTSIVILYFWLILLMFTIGILSGLANKELEEKTNKKQIAE